jgi:hypothetical protein
MTQEIIPKVIPKVFFFPEVEEYPFDNVCKNIVQALYQRGWSVPGITVEFDESFIGHNRSMWVNHVKGDDFHIDFFRVQSRDHESKLTNMAAANRIGIPKWQLEVYEDYSGPSFYVYVGENWDVEKNRFFRGLKVNSKLYGEPRTYLKYSGTDSKYSNTLKHDHDIGREYELNPDDKSIYLIKEVYDGITGWLVDNVLNMILKYPTTPPVEVAPHILTPFKDVEKLGGDAKLTILTTDREKYEKIRDNMNDEMALPPYERYAFTQCTRLLNLGIPAGDTIKEIAHDGFVWSEPGCISTTDDLKKSLLYRRLDIDGGFMQMNNKIYSIIISPKYSNEIYVIDASSREEFKRNYFETNPEQSRMRDTVYDMFLKVEAQTLVPLSEYDGSFKEPMIIFRRNVELDEAIATYIIQTK